MSMKWMRLAASAVLLAGALGVAHAQCKYKKIGSIPYEWVGPRLTIAQADAALQRTAGLAAMQNGGSP